MLAMERRESSSNGAAAAPALSWDAEMIRNRNTGEPRALIANAALALERAPGMEELLAFDEFSLDIALRRQPPWSSREMQADEPWADHDSTGAAVWMQREHAVHASSAVAGEAAVWVARKRSFHPVRRWLRSLHWDGDPRLDTWLSKYLGAPAAGYTASIGRCFLIGAVARIMEPGCKVDNALILEGPQGILKSTAIRILAGGEQWYTDDIPPIGTKDAQISLCGKWIFEISELDAMLRADPAAIKSFISRQVDRYRPPYARKPIKVPRQCVFIGTTNQTEWMRDETGNRRQWAVPCTKIDIDALIRDQPQLWAEAVALYENGTSVFPTDAKVIGEIRAEQHKRMESDVWEDKVLRWCESPERLPDAHGRGAPPLSSLPFDVTIADILTHCIERPIERQDQPAKNRIVRILKSAGWDMQPVWDGSRTVKRYRPLKEPADSKP